jgi:hypothetical protein
MENKPSNYEMMDRDDWMKLSGEERLIIGCKMFDAYRDGILASLPKVLSPIEWKRRFYQRIYGEPLPF